MDKKINFVDQLINNDIFYLYICSLVSADTIIDYTSANKSILDIQILKLHTFTSKLATEKHINYIKEAEKIAMDRLKTFK